MKSLPKKPEEVKDEPGAEDRFMRGVKRALDTPPKPHEELKAARRRQLQSKISKQKVGQDSGPGRSKGISKD